MEKHIGMKIKVLYSDNGGEYTSDPFLHLCREEGIERHFSQLEKHRNRMGGPKG